MTCSFISFIIQLELVEQLTNKKGESMAELTIPSDERLFKNPKTREIGRYIFGYMNLFKGRAPTIREIGRAVGGVRSKNPMSPSNVMTHLKLLEEAGIIKTHGIGRSRSISIINAGYQVPVLPSSLIDQSRTGHVWFLNIGGGE